MGGPGAPKGGVPPAQAPVFLTPGDPFLALSFLPATQPNLGFKELGGPKGSPGPQTGKKTGVFPTPNWPKAQRGEILMGKRSPLGAPSGLNPSF